ncbi:RNA polymerase II subunit B1 CTD phosphatase Rpap2 [Strongylocentrotus purpuratus]|uniref:RNA polymerase II subunit B1 CTD phosphatase RPAP2 homolog n=1 Tax=Strongylocentrotus purpuratus TaxID=7668 RepID=A0A7M7T4J8_STRPU|nr:RNA polymerase II subunit B1 CTD phosphatase Rpap2 [Strongylocentrotus purpuratus]
MATSSGKTKNVGKSNRLNDGKRKEELLVGARKRVECEKKAMKIVERLLEESISESFFEDCGKYITSNQFEDVAVERAIEKLCGYPLCTNKLTSIPRQQYHISLKSKKVFDITERKNFCSQRCFQAHAYYQTQLSDEPVWAREHKNIPPIKLFENDASAATNAPLKHPHEIPLKHKITMPDVDTVSERTAEGAGEGEKGLHLGVSGLSLDRSNEGVDGGRKDKDKRREEMLRRVAESVERPARDGQREEVQSSGSHVEGSSYAVEPSSSVTVGQEDMKHTVTPEELHLSNQVKPVQTCSASNIVNERLVMPNNGNTDGDWKDEPNQINPVQIGSEESKDTDVALGESGRKDNVGDLTAQPDDHGVTVKKEEADEIQQEKTVSSTDTRTSKEKKKTKKKKKKVPVAENTMLVILQHIQQCLMEWRTVETLRYIYGRSSSQSGNQGCIDEPVPDTVPETDPNLERKKMALKEFEKRAGDRLDREEIKEGAFPAPSKPLPDFESLRREEEEKYALKVKEYFMGREMKTPSKPATEEKEEEPNKLVENTVDRTGGLPPVDSRAQVTIRRRILLDKLTQILPGIAVSLQLSVHEVSPMMTDLVRTFHPGSHNIVFKPLAWNLMTLILIHM